MCAVVLVVEKPEDWFLEVPGVELVTAREYLTDDRFSAAAPRLKVFNLCKSYRYQSSGYYVSLLAEARGHRPLPGVGTIQDLKSPALVRFASEDLDALVQRSLGSLTSNRFVLSIYFSRNVARRHERLARELFNLFPSPLLRAQFRRTASEHGDLGPWQLTGLRPIATKDIPPEHQSFVVEAATQHFARRPAPPSRKVPWRWDLAILVDPQEGDPPSDDKALQRFQRAARRRGVQCERLTRDDFGRLGEFDALFLRTSTRVDDYTYRFSRRAAAEGLVVIDDPRSILRCTNKVYLAELLNRAHLPIPRSLVVHKDNLAEAAEQLGFPSILKLPDSSFSQGVARAEDRQEFETRARQFLEDSDLLIAQEFLPTDFDWRVGVLDGQALYVCKYHMARAHWQIIKRDSRGRARSGKVEALPLEEAPAAVIDVAVRAASLIGDGLYGVDLKESAGKIYVIEINDNPSLDAGYEDAVAGDLLYDRILDVFVERLERRAAGRGASSESRQPEGFREVMS